MVNWLPAKSQGKSGRFWEHTESWMLWNDGCVHYLAIDDVLTDVYIYQNLSSCTLWNMQFILSQLWFNKTVTLKMAPNINRLKSEGKIEFYQNIFVLSWLDFSCQSYKDFLK
jgi:hypothetical protein